jgi:hypothetical protein
VQPLRICSLCVELLDVDGAGISMVTREGHRGVVCATNDVSARIEDMQFTLGEGPCVDAVSDGHPVLIADLTDDSELAPDRWPTFLADAAAAGVRATFAFPLNIGAIMLGALDLYRHRPGELTAEQLAAALLAADAAALALLELTGDGNDGFGEDGALRSAYHLQVHRASGMLVVQLGVSIEEALLRLRAHAFASGRSLESVATDIVERRLRLPAEQT